MSRKSKAAEFLEEAYNINVTGRHVVVTDAMKDYAIEKISKIERFSNRIIDVVVTMDVQKLDHRVDIVLKVNNIKIKSQAVSDNMYTSIDRAVQKIESQLLKYKNKIQDHQSKASLATDMNVNVLRSASDLELSELNDEIESENRRRLMDKYMPHKIVSKATRPLKDLTDGEAMMKLDLSGDPFIVYRCEESPNRQIKIMYRRKDGDYGVITPEEY